MTEMTVFLDQNDRFSLNLMNNGYFVGVFK